jgi:hypothetical protein
MVKSLRWDARDDTEVAVWPRTLHGERAVKEVPKSATERPIYLNGTSGTHSKEEVQGVRDNLALRGFDKFSSSCIVR